MNKTAAHVIGNSWIEILARWILGFTFIYASYHKILEPAEFARIIYGYDLFPASIINLSAIIVPFVELTAGIFLILGIFPRSAVLIINAMLVVFIVFLSINLIRGHAFDCGCFAPQLSGNEPSMVSVIARDSVFLLLGMYVFLYNRARRWCIRPTL